MGVVVFIPTKARPDLLTKVLPRWAAQPNVDAIIPTVEPQDVDDYRSIAQMYKKVHLFKLRYNDMGVNYARNRIVRAAKRQGLDSFIMADDDHQPRPDSDVSMLCRDLKDTPTMGMGIMLSFYGLSFGNDVLAKESVPLLSLNSFGKAIYALHTERVIAAGNFDVRFRSGWGDDELVREGMRTHGFGWWVHAGVKGASINTRYSKGGVNALHNERPEARQEAQEESHRIAFEKWGAKYINKPGPGKRLICKWRRMLDDFVPDWEELATWRKA